jgi:hypothetical protein
VHARAISPPQRLVVRPGIHQIPQSTAAVTKTDPLFHIDVCRFQDKGKSWRREAWFAGNPTLFSDACRAALLPRYVVTWEEGHEAAAAGGGGETACGSQSMLRTFQRERHARDFFESLSPHCANRSANVPRICRKSSCSSCSCSSSSSHHHRPFSAAQRHCDLCPARPCNPPLLFSFPHPLNQVRGTSPSLGRDQRIMMVGVAGYSQHCNNQNL